MGLADKEEVYLCLLVSTRVDDLEALFVHRT